MTDIPMIVSGLTGGLGNQMFQYAMGYRVAQERRLSFALDITAYTSYDNPGVLNPRPYVLDHLRIEAKPLPEAEARKLQPSFPRLRRRLPWLAPFLPDAIHRFYEKQFFYDPAAIDAPVPCYFNGYWQTEKYFAPVADSIRRQFQLAAPMTETRRATAGAIEAQAHAVSVHVRRGDYVTHAAANAMHGTCSPQWYEAAMGKMAGWIGTPHFFVFSDDPEWACANLPKTWPTSFVLPQADRRDFEDMHLMALCKHHIIANSSFSWWGAWLNPSPDKRVIAPLQWFANAPHDTRDIIPESWTRM